MRTVMTTWKVNFVCFLKKNVNLKNKSDNEQSLWEKTFEKSERSITLGSFLLGGC